MIKTLGNGWTFTLLASFNIVGACLLIVVYSKGREWREKYIKKIGG
jgi:hypothetical protein